MSPTRTSRIRPLLNHAGWRYIFVFIATAVVALSGHQTVAPVHAADLETTELGAGWDLGPLAPGTEAVIRDAIHVRVISTTPWSLDVTGGLAAKVAGADDVRSELEYTLRESSGGTGDDPIARGSDEVGLTLGGQPATPAHGRAFVLDVALRPSWDDPAGETMTADLNLSVTSDGESAVLASLVEPNPLLSGFPGPITFWYWLHDVDGGPSAVELSVDRNGDRFGQAEGAPPSPGWNAIGWTPADPLPPDLYGYEIVADDGVPLARGAFRVYDPAEWISQGDMGPMSFLAGSGSAAGHRPAANAPQAMAYVLPVVGMEVRPLSDGRSWRTWEATLVNASPFAALEVQVEICPPPGWAWHSSDALWKSAERDEPLGGGADREAVCHTALIGTIPGHSEKSFRFSLYPLLPVVAAGVVGVDRQPRRPWISLYVRSAPAIGQKGVIVHEARVPFDPGAFATTIRGRTFVDINGSGSWEEGEPPAPGVDIIADGVRVGRSTVSGTFSIQLDKKPMALWGRTPRGSGNEILVSGHLDLRSVWVVDLPIPNTLVHAAHDPGGDGVTELFLETGASGGVEGFQGGAGVRLFRSFDQWELSAGAGVGRREIRSQAGIVPETAVTLDADASLHGDAATITASFRHGLAEGVRWGGLRPTKPVEGAWRVGVEAEPHVTVARSGRGALVNTAFELAEAVGDLWRCRLVGLSGEWSAGDQWFTGEWRRGGHVRLDAKGERRGAYGSTTLGMRGLVDFDGVAWPYRLDLAWGVKRALAPSCGLTPKEGFHGNLRLSTPQGGSGDLAAGEFLSGLHVAMSAWPSGYSSDSEDADAESAMLPKEQAFEIRAESVNLVSPRESGATLQVSPFLQWGVAPDMDPGSWTALGVRSEGRVNGHRLTLEAGPKHVADRRPSADDPLERAGRLAGSWTYQGGAVRPRLAFDRYGGSGGDYDWEAGIAIDVALRPERLPWIGSETNLGLSLDRTLSEAARKDKATLTMSRGGRTKPTDRLTLEWSGKLEAKALPYFGGGQTYDEATLGVTLGRTRAGVLLTRGEHDARPVFDAQEWRVRIGYAQDAGTVEYSRALTAEGLWLWGTWLVDIRQAEGLNEGDRFASAGARAAFDARSGPWGLAIQLFHEGTDLAHAADRTHMTGSVVRAMRRISPAFEAFVQIGRSLTLIGGSGGLSSTGSDERPLRKLESIAVGVTLDLSKVESASVALKRFPLLITAGVEGVLSHASDDSSSRGAEPRFFISAGIPLAFHPVAID